MDESDSSILLVNMLSISVLELSHTLVGKVFFWKEFMCNNFIKVFIYLYFRQILELEDLLQNQ